MRLRPALFAVASGWVATLALLYLGNLLLRTAAPSIPLPWLPTVQLTFNCFELFGAAFITGRLNRPAAMTTVSIFLATLILVELADADLLPIPLDVPWLIRLTRDVLTDRRYLDSWLNAAAVHLLLLGCLLAGGLLSRPPQKPLSLR
jgi:hypothetical protein